MLYTLPCVCAGSDLLKQLMSLLEPLVHWDRLGLQLGFSVPEIKKIDKKERGCVNDCLEAILRRWMQEHGDVKKLGREAKEALVSALVDIEEVALSEVIAQADL